MHRDTEELPLTTSRHRGDGVTRRAALRGIGGGLAQRDPVALREQAAALVATRWPRFAARSLVLRLDRCAGGLLSHVTRLLSRRFRPRGSTGHRPALRACRHADPLPGSQRDYRHWTSGLVGSKPRGLQPCAIGGTPIIPLSLLSCLLDHIFNLHLHLTFCNFRLHSSLHDSPHPDHPYTSTPHLTHLRHHTPPPPTPPCRFFAGTGWSCSSRANAVR